MDRVSLWRRSRVGDGMDIQLGSQPPKNEYCVPMHRFQDGDLYTTAIACSRVLMGVCGGPAILRFSTANAFVRLDKLREVINHCFESIFNVNAVWSEVAIAECAYSEATM